VLIKRDANRFKALFEGAGGQLEVVRYQSQQRELPSSPTRCPLKLAQLGRHL